MNTVAQSTPLVTAEDLPRIFGEQDAAAGASCCPEMYWIRRDDQRAYCRGYEAVAGATITTQQFLGREVAR